MRSDEIELRIFDTGEEVTGWKSYRYTQDFLTPTDAWEASIAFGDIAKTRELFAKLTPGTRVTLVINGKAQCTGYVDGRTLKRSREGTELHVHGRDVIAPMVDSSVDPLFRLSPKHTLNDVLAKIATPFGFTVFSTTDIANRDVLTGHLKSKTRKIQTSPTQKVELFQVKNDKQGVLATTQQVTPETIGEYDPTRPKFLKDLELTSAKPPPGEGCFEFCARLAKRFRLWIWANAIGDQLSRVLGDRVRVINNADWLHPLRAIDFLRTLAIWRHAAAHSAHKVAMELDQRGEDLGDREFVHVERSVPSAPESAARDGACWILRAIWPPCTDGRPTACSRPPMRTRPRLLGCETSFRGGSTTASR